MDGILVVDKPRGPTSADVVAQVKRLLGAGRVGHTGTLDPMATGVLPIAVGEGTKLAPYLLAEDKAYEGELELGLTTDTLDAEGTVTARGDASAVTALALAEAFSAWVGEKSQIPPMYSALRQGGKRLYELARAGVEVEREPRPVRIDAFDLLDFTLPRARFRVACSKGTYVRALVRDVGAALGCGATLTALRRTAAGAFTVADAVPLADVTRDAPLIDPARALAHLPALTLDAASLRRVVTGQPLAPLPPETHPEGTLLALLTPVGRLAAVAEVKDARPRTLRVLNYGLTEVSH
jgi:tRNA pseudouridine55 synthase